MPTDTQRIEALEQVVLSHTEWIATYERNAAAFTENIRELKEKYFPETPARDPDGTLPPDLPQRVSAHALTPAQVNAAREARGLPMSAHYLTPGQVEALRERAGGPETMAISVSEFELATRATRERASLYAGIRDVYEMLDRERPADPGSIVHAALARLAAILDKA